uniref:type IIL restriction-modification enzyme MmeI n=1 Tax=Gordonia sp. B7-2 TaxID=3420932 RepID=UPI003D8ECD08
MWGCLAADARNAEVLFPYLNGDDLNSRPDSSAARWVIDFNDRSEEEAAEYPLPFNRILKLVKPERRKLRPDGKYVMRSPLPERWWQYGEKRPALRAAIASLPEVLVISRVSKTVMPMRVPTGQVFSDKLDVFATASFSDQAVLSSSLHQLWAITYGSTLEARVAYTPSYVFETFPLPDSTGHLEQLGSALQNERKKIMARRKLGLTRLYNLVNDSAVGSSDVDVSRLRELHVELDRAVLAAYRWDDLRPGHGFHTVRQMRRFTLDDTARFEVLDRLLAENRLRAAT